MKLSYIFFSLLFCIACQQPSTSKALVDEVSHLQIGSSDGAVTDNADSTIKDDRVFLQVKPNHFKADDDSVKLVYVVTNNVDSIIQFGSYFVIEKWEANEWKVVPFQDNIAFIDIMYGLEPGEAKEYPFPFFIFADKDYQLAGKYRLIKEVFQRGKEKKEIQLVSEFILE